jgi:TetR/AcrR family transcriptional regulator, cholesterol catabolism regulator
VDAYKQWLDFKGCSTIKRRGTIKMPKKAMPKIINISKQDKKSQKTQIINQARRLFWQKGYRETTIKDIAYACHWSLSNIYHYYPNKEAILFEIMTNVMNTLLKLTKYLEDDEETNPLEQLRKIIHIQLSLVLRYIKTPDILFETELRHLSKDKQREIIKLRKIYENIIQKIIYRGIKAGLFAEVNVKLTSFTIIAIIVRSRIWYSPSGSISIDEIADIICQFIINGIKNQKQS